MAFLVVPKSTGLSLRSYIGGVTACDVIEATTSSVLTILVGQVRNVVPGALLLCAPTSNPINADFIRHGDIVIWVVSLSVPWSNIAVSKVVIGDVCELVFGDIGLTSYLLGCKFDGRVSKI